MPAQRTLGMGLVAVVSLFFGTMVALGNTLELLRGSTFDGSAVTWPTVGLLGVCGALAAAALALAGWGTWTLRGWARPLALGAAVAHIALSAVATVHLDLPDSFFLTGSAYPALLLVLYNLPSWRLRFAGIEPAPPSAVSLDL